MLAFQAEAGRVLMARGHASRAQAARDHASGGCRESAKALAAAGYKYISTGCITADLQTKRFNVYIGRLLKD
jgi:hypothetical protein